MSAFGSYGDDDAFEEEALDTNYIKSQLPVSNEPTAPVEEPPMPVSPQPAVNPHAFDDEEDLGSPLDASVQSRIEQERYQPQPLARPQPQPQSSESPLTINAAHAAHYAATTAQAGPSQPRSGGGHAHLPRIHTSPPTFDDAKASLDALWALSSTSDPTLFSHAVYAHQAYFGKGDVAVVEPEKRSDALSSYIVYKVKSTVEWSAGQVSDLTVFRRYSDFLWLHEQLFLAPALAGFLIPPIPDKAVMGRFGEDFVEERRRTLELFMKRVVAHPVLREQEEVIAFLRAQDAQWSQARKRTRKEVIQGLQGAQSGGVLGFIKGRVQLTGAKHAAASPDDALCEKADDYAAKLEGELGQLDIHLDKLMQREKAMARTWVELGMACGLISQMEGAVNERSNVAVFGTLGSMSDQVAVMLARKVELERQGIRDAVKDYMRMSEAVQTMMKLRGIVSNNYYEALGKLEALQKKPGKDVTAHQRAISEAQQVLNSRQQELHDCTNRARVEFGRFQKEKARALKQATLHFVQLQIEQAKQTEAAWTNILADFQDS